MDTIVILDFGGQYCHLISRRIRDLGVFAEVLPSDTPSSKLSSPHIRGVILSGGARSVYEKNAPKFDPKILELGIPILGICYGHQLIAKVLGGKVVSGASGEYGQMLLSSQKTSGVLARFKSKEMVWMNHRDVVVKVPAGFTAIASTEHSAIAAYMDPRRHIYGVQFHPEVSHTPHGDTIYASFIFDICKTKKTWSSKQLLKNIIAEAKTTLGGERAIIGLSGGIDSSVAAMLVGRAIGANLTAIYVDTGLMRYKETEEVKRAFAKEKLKLKVVYAARRFFKALKGVTDPETKRKIIGKVFIDVFYEAAKTAKANYLIQGTIYSDRIESGLTKHSSTIKSHHNVGGLPKNLKLKLYEPLRGLYKDEVRKLGGELRLSPIIQTRQVFPGPGLAIRIIGEVTPENVEIVRQAGKIIEDELRPTKHWKDIWMSFPVLLPIKSVGVQGDERSYKRPIVLRIVESRDAMTANFAKIPYDILERISTRITNEVKEINRVVYDITHKPPATMEWE